jgi:hypothetical protein
MPHPRSILTWSNQLQRKPQPKGHAVSLRITAENTDTGFKPSSGSLQERNFALVITYGVTSPSAPLEGCTNLLIHNLDTFSHTERIMERVGKHDRYAEGAYHSWGLPNPGRISNQAALEAFRENTITMG